jgi:hypothetical protein
MDIKQNLDRRIPHSKWKIPVHIYLLILSMEKSPSWETNRFSASQIIPSILWSPTVHYPFKKAATYPYPETDQSRPRLTHPTSWRSILILSYHLCLFLRRGLFLSGSPTKRCMNSFSPPRATCHVVLIFLDLITRKIFGNQYRSLSSTDH